jgi:hypothetical protein
MELSVALDDGIGALEHHPSARMNPTVAETTPNVPTPGSLPGTLWVIAPLLEPDRQAPLATAVTNDTRSFHRAIRPHLSQRDGRRRTRFRHPKQKRVRHTDSPRDKTHGDNRTDHRLQSHLHNLLAFDDRSLNDSNARPILIPHPRPDWRPMTNCRDIKHPWSVEHHRFH